MEGLGRVPFEKAVHDVGQFAEREAGLPRQILSFPSLVGSREYLPGRCSGNVEWEMVALP
jgi:hypothetical protein